MCAGYIFGRYIFKYQNSTFKHSLASFAMSSNIHSNLRGVFVGSGSGGMSQPQVADAILKLVRDNKPASSTNILYIGTATYDLPVFCDRQTQRFVERGCNLSSLNVATKDDPNAGELISNADVIFVSGGNTLYAVDRWNKLGLAPHFRSAMERGVVLSGGSAGAICWFDGGHSDSMDPDTYKDAMLSQYGDKPSGGAEESSSVSQDVKDWKYIRVNGLKLLPGLVCPHHDQIQSNGVLRANDFDEMLLRHSGEQGLCIDHWAALCITGDDYYILPIEGKSGSVVRSEGMEPKFSPNEGVPGIWIKKVIDGQVTISICPEKGKIADLLKDASTIVEDKSVEKCRHENPSS